MSKKNGGSAFPALSTEWGGLGDEQHYRTVPGMTLRQYYAAHALQGFAAAGEAKSMSATLLAKVALMYADALIAAEERE